MMKLYASPCIVYNRKTGDMLTDSGTVVFDSHKMNLCTKGYNETYRDGTAHLNLSDVEYWKYDVNKYTNDYFIYIIAKDMTAMFCYRITGLQYAKNVWDYYYDGQRTNGLSTFGKFLKSLLFSPTDIRFLGPYTRLVHILIQQCNKPSQLSKKQFLNKMYDLEGR